MRQVPVLVPLVDLYGHLGGVFACIGPIDGPVQALGFLEEGLINA